MEHINNIITEIISNFNFAYMISVNLLTYFIIKLLDIINKEKEVSTILKRIVLIISIIIMASIYHICDFNDDIKIINSSILAPVFWSWILKPIFKKFGIGYKDIDKYLN